MLCHHSLGPTIVTAFKVQIIASLIHLLSHLERDATPGLKLSKMLCQGKASFQHFLTPLREPLNALCLLWAVNHLNLVTVNAFGYNYVITVLLCAQTRPKRSPQVAPVHPLCAKSPFQAPLDNHWILSPSWFLSPILHSSSPLP